METRCATSTYGANLVTEPSRRHPPFDPVYTVTSNSPPMLGTLEHIWIKRAKRGPMDAALFASLRADRGLVGNANQGGRRQITILEAERWSAHMTALGTTLDPSVRRANL